MKKTLLLSLIALILLVSTVYASESKLEIKDLTIYSGSDYSRSVKNNDTFSEIIEPGEELEFEIEIENAFKEDIDINDIEIIIKVNNITQGEDIIEDTTKFDLKYEKSKTKNIKLDIPSNADEITKSVDISINGVDEEGTVHKIDWTIYIRIEDESHSIWIYNTNLNQTTVDCKGTVKLIIWLSNDGNYDESKVVLEAKNKELGLDNIYTGIDIDEDEKYSKIIFIDIEDIETGNYPIELKAYYKNTHLDDIKTINLAVNACEAEDSVIDDIDEDSDEDMVEAEQDIVISDTVEQSYTPPIKKKDQTIIMAFSIVLIMLIIIISLSVFLLKNNRIN